MPLKRTTLLHALACIGIALGFAPLFNLATAIFGGKPIQNLPILIWLVISGLAGYHFHLLLQQRTSFSSVLRSLCCLLCGLLVGGAAFIPLFTMNWLHAVIAAVLFTIVFLRCSRLVRREPDSILSASVFWKLLGFYMVFLVLTWIVGRFLPEGYSHFVSAVCFLIITILYVIIRNQCNIDSLTVSRHYSLDNLPKKIRAYNLFLIGGILLVISISFFAATLLAPHMGGIGEWLRELLTSLLTGAPQEQTETPLPESNGMNGSPLPPELMEGNDSLLWLGKLLQFLFGGLLVAGILAVIVFNRQRIAVEIRLAFERLRKFLELIFSQASRLKQEEETAEYTDYNQSVASEIQKERPAGIRQRTRQWHSDYRRYLHMEESEKKYRTGYGLLISGFSLCGAKILPTDTTLEIAEKATLLWEEHQRIEKGEYQTVTTAYNLLRYGEKAYLPGQVGALDLVLSEVRDFHRREKPLKKR